MKRPSQGNQPRECTLEDGTVQKWCRECGSWGNHLRVNHPTDANGVGIGNLVEAVEENDNDMDAVVDGEVLTRLRVAGLA